MSEKLSHVAEDGSSRMVDVTGKALTDRRAVVRAVVRLAPETLRLLREKALPKGDVLNTARIAGILAAKQTHTLIPMCHPLPINGVEIDFEVDDATCEVRIEATVTTTARTGVEMEALVAAQIAAATIYDMCKAVQKDIVVADVRLIHKSGGKSGTYQAD